MSSFAGRTGNGLCGVGVWLGPVHLGVLKCLGEPARSSWPRLSLRWMSVDEGCGGDGSGRVLRLTWRPRRVRDAYGVRLQFGGSSQPWRGRLVSR